LSSAVLPGFSVLFCTRFGPGPFFRSAVLPGFSGPFWTRAEVGPFLSIAVLPGLNVGPFLRIFGSTFVILKRGLSLAMDRRNVVAGLLTLAGLKNDRLLERANERDTDARGAENDMLRPRASAGAESYNVRAASAAAEIDSMPRAFIAAFLQVQRPSSDDLPLACHHRLSGELRCSTGNRNGHGSRLRRSA
jgi:hypothetical protein